MRLICPSCGAEASLEAWQNDATFRQLVDVISKLPGPVASRTPAYLGLFRRGKRGLTWQRALRIASDLLDLVGPGTVHWDNEEERPAPAQHWAAALDIVLARRPTALEDHNYLRKICWQEARGLAAEAERQVNIRKAHPVISDSEGEREPAARRKSCFTCASFRAPRGCAISSKPPSENLMLGCEKWAQKAASAGGLMASLLDGLAIAPDGDDGEK